MRPRSTEQAAAAPEFRVVTSRSLQRMLIGAQFNHHVYADITGAPEESFPDLHAKVEALRPQFVRLFYNDEHFSEHEDRRRSFYRAVDLAHQTGAEINITWQSGPEWWDKPGEGMQRFGAVLTDLVRGRNITNLGWVTVQNEANATRITFTQYKNLYRELDRVLRDAGVRSQIRFMGGDLLEQSRRGQLSQEEWFRFLATEMRGLLDAYAVHIYWRYADTAKLERRLTQVRTIVDGLPSGGRKPVYVTEYGVYGDEREDAPPPWFYSDGTPIAQTNIAAFQHAWFHIRAAQLGYRASVKWDCYQGNYGKQLQDFYAIGPWRHGWPRYPMYFLLQLLSRTTKPAWRVVRVDPVRQPTEPKLVTAFRGVGGGLTIFGLATAGGRSNRPPPRHVPYAIAGLRKRATLALVVWNGSGTGKNEVVASVVADEAGVARFSAPLRGVFALTTRPEI